MRGQDIQVLENDTMAINLSEQVALLLCALVCPALTFLRSSLFLVSVSVSPHKLWWGAMGLLILGSQHLAKSSAQEPRAVLVESSVSFRKKWVRRGGASLSLWCWYQVSSSDLILPKVNVCCLGCIISQLSILLEGLSLVSELAESWVAS